MVGVTYGAILHSASVLLGEDAPTEKFSRTLLFSAAPPHEKDPAPLLLAPNASEFPRGPTPSSLCRLLHTPRNEPGYWALYQRRYTFTGTLKPSRKADKNAVTRAICEGGLIGTASTRPDTPKRQHTGSTLQTRLKPITNICLHSHTSVCSHPDRRGGPRARDWGKAANATQAEEFVLSKSSPADFFSKKVHSVRLERLPLT